MGRHSAPGGDDEDVDVVEPVAGDERQDDHPAGSGRHSAHADRSGEGSDGGGDGDGNGGGDQDGGEDVGLPAILSAGAETDETPTLVIGAGAPAPAPSPAADDAAAVAHETSVLSQQGSAAASEDASENELVWNDRSAGPRPGAADEKPAARDTGTRADLRLLREQPALRVRCGIAFVVPFVLELVVLIVLGRAGDYLLWVWIPAIVAGVTVGSMLDLAHRSGEPAPPSDSAPSEPAPSEPAPSEPAPSGPAPSGPAPSGPAPSEPVAAGDDDGGEKNDDEHGSGRRDGPPGGATLSIADTATIPAVGRGGDDAAD